MKIRHILVLIASVLFSGQLAIAQEDKPTPTDQLFAAVKDSETTPEIIANADLLPSKLMDGGQAHP